MKRLIFYGLLFVQAAIILLVAIQYYLIDDYGKSVLLLSEEPLNTYKHDGEISYLEYEINYLPAVIWEMEEELNYREKFYVVLTPDDAGIYHASRATKEKPELHPEEVSLQATYSYYDSIRKEYRVDYGIERVTQIIDTDLNQNKQSVITLKVAPWGQKAVMEITEL